MKKPKNFASRAFSFVARRIAPALMASAMIASPAYADRVEDDTTPTVEDTDVGDIDVTPDTPAPETPVVTPDGNLTTGCSATIPCDPENPGGPGSVSIQLMDRCDLNPGEAVP